MTKKHFQPSTPAASMALQPPNLLLLGRYSGALLVTHLVSDYVFSVEVSFISDRVGVGGFIGTARFVGRCIESSNIFKGNDCSWLLLLHFTAE